MNRYIKYFLLFIIFSAFYCSCSEDKLDLYLGGKDSIFIMESMNTSNYSVNDTIVQYKEFSFGSYNDDVKEYTLTFQVKLSGYPKEYDRKYILSVLTDSCTCSVNDYSLDENDFTINAGCASDTVRVKLFRNESLVQNTVRLYLQIEPNENFDIAIKEFKNSDYWNVEATKIKTDLIFINFGETYVEPNYWKNMGRSYLGNFSPKKYLLVNSLMEWTPSDWAVAGNNGAVINYAPIMFAAEQMQIYLQNLANEGNPVIDDDGSFMQLAGNYMVDYSAYE